MDPAVADGGERSVFTVGHAALPVEGFLAMLRGGGVEAVADVRRHPGSRRSPQFGADVLAASLPEAGGDLARYFDPYCVTDAYAAIRRTLADRVDLAAWREQVQREFRPVPWTETAEAVLRHLGAGA